MEADLVKVFAPHDLGGKDRVRDADHLHNCMAGYSLQSHDCTFAANQPASYACLVSSVLLLIILSCNLRNT